MKQRNTLLALALLLLLPSARAQDTLLLFHPTAYNIELIGDLADSGYLDLEDIHVLGVFHEKENYDYEESRQWLIQEPDPRISLLEINLDISQGQVFRSNSCSGLFRTLFMNSVGALFMGGPDIPPALFGENVHLLTRVTDPYRHYLELSYIFHLLGGAQDPGWQALILENKDYLISGICLGMQTLNVATGGSMVQDIPTELYGIWDAERILELPADQQHRNYRGMVEDTCPSPTSYHFHHIDIPRSSFLKKDLKYKKREKPLVLSSHHQALEDLGAGWEVAARSMDGKIVEAINHKEYPHVFGVQFHPEKPGLFDPGISHPESCDQDISFNRVIADSHSYSFHLVYWQYISKIIQQSRTSEKRD